MTCAFNVNIFNLYHSIDFVNNEPEHSSHLCTQKKTSKDTYVQTTLSISCLYVLLVFATFTISTTF